jgi:phage terminase small subunit
MAHKHTEQRKRFVAEYLRDLNGKAAAIRAGYSANGADVTAARLLGDAKIGRDVARRQAQRLERLDVRADHVLEGLRRVAFCDPADFFDAEGHVLPIHEIPVEARMALAGVRVQKDGTIGITLNNRVEALDKLARHLDLLQPEVPVAPAGPVTVNFTDVYLDGLSEAELVVLERVLARQAEVDRQYGLLPPETNPRPEGG